MTVKLLLQHFLLVFPVNCHPREDKSRRPYIKCFMGGGFTAGMLKSIELEAFCCAGTNKSRTHCPNFMTFGMAFSGLFSLNVFISMKRGIVSSKVSKCSLCFRQASPTLLQRNLYCIGLVCNCLPVAHQPCNFRQAKGPRWIFFPEFPPFGGAHIGPTKHLTQCTA